jgi:hypothetical protein
MLSPPPRPRRGIRDDVEDEGGGDGGRLLPWQAAGRRRRCIPAMLNRASRDARAMARARHSTFGVHTPLPRAATMVVSGGNSSPAAVGRRGGLSGPDRSPLIAAPLIASPDERTTGDRPSYEVREGVEFRRSSPSSDISPPLDPSTPHARR